MNTRNAPLSPVSLGGGDWPVNKYPNRADDPYSNNRGLMSPPASGGFNANMNGFPSGPGRSAGPSPPPSVGRSSGYAQSEGGRSMRSENAEAILGEHYVALKRYLASTSKDGRANPPPNKALDKLLRLSSVQFLELSTDVFDELIRRQAVSRKPSKGGASGGPPAYLLPEDNFHPKRNQARRKLSTLGPPKFRDLATDVFCELERRFPHFVSGDIPRMGTPMSGRGPPSRSQTPVNGASFPARGAGMRRPSDASSARSRSGTPKMNNDYAVPPSPGLSNGSFSQPQQKQFQSNTIIPNKSTMVEEDEDDPSGDNDENDAFGLDAQNDRTSKRSRDTEKSAMSEADKKLLDEYQVQVRELRDKLDTMEDQAKRREDEMNSLLNEERSRATNANMERQEWADTRMGLEKQVAEAQRLNDSLRDELARMAQGHDMETRQLRDEIQEARQSSRAPVGRGDAEMQRENEELQIALREQQQVTEEVRRNARTFLEEMRVLAQQHGQAWERQTELEKTVEQLEQEVGDWRNRYARAKTRLRSLRASSLGLAVDQDAAQYVREKGFTQDNGLVKDVHVTQFQMSIDELLAGARKHIPEKTLDSMKAVVVSVRRIIKDIGDSRAAGEEALQQQQKLKSRVSATANSLITASKNFASGAGLSPVSLLDAAASHLVAAVVELLRVVKIRATPAGELEDDDDGALTPVDSTAFFSNRTTQQDPGYGRPGPDAIPPLAPPPPFQGLRGARDSTQSSAYSPVSSPRESLEQYNPRRPMAGNGAVNGAGGAGYRMRQNSGVEDLKVYLDNQSAVLVQTVQDLVSLVRNDAPMDTIGEDIGAIVEIVGKVLDQTEASGNGGDALDRLASCRQRLFEAGARGQDLWDGGLGTGDREWRMWTQTLPPIAFEIAREMKELVRRIDSLFMSGGADDFS